MSLEQVSVTLGIAVLAVGGLTQLGDATENAIAGTAGGAPAHVAGAGPASMAGSTEGEGADGPNAAGGGGAGGDGDALDSMATDAAALAAGASLHTTSADGHDHDHAHDVIAGDAHADAERLAVHGEELGAGGHTDDGGFSFGKIFDKVKSGLSTAAGFVKDKLEAVRLALTGKAEAQDGDAGGKCSLLDVGCHLGKVGSALQRAGSWVVDKVTAIPGWISKKLFGTESLMDGLDKTLGGAGPGDDLKLPTVNAAGMSLDDAALSPAPALAEDLMTGGAAPATPVTPPTTTPAGPPTGTTTTQPPPPPPPPPPPSKEQQLMEIVASLPYSAQVNWQVNSFEGHLGTYCSAAAAPNYGCAPETIYIAPRVFDKPRDFQVAVISHELAHVATMRAYNAGDPVVVEAFQAFANKYTGGNIQQAFEFAADAVCTGWNNACGAFRHYVTPSAEMVSDAMTLIR